MGNKSGKTKPEYNSESQHREAFLTEQTSHIQIGKKNRKDIS